MDLIIIYNLALGLLINFFPTTIAEEEKKPKDQTGELVNNLRLTHWDDWDGNATCSKGLYMIGLRLRYGIEDIIEKNMSVVTGFELTCSNRLISNHKTVHQATFGKGGNWSKNGTECKSGFAMGIAANLSPTSSYIHASSNILSLNMYCSDSPRDATGRAIVRQENAIKPEQVQDSRDYEEFCESGEAITGLSIRADSVITFYKGDSTSVKGIGMECRKVENPVSSCLIKLRWETRPGLKCGEALINPSKATLQSLRSHSEVNCTFQTWIGIGPNVNKEENVTNIIKSYTSLGRNNDEDFVRRTILKKLLRPEIKTWFTKKFPNTPQILETFVVERMGKNMQNITREIVHRYKTPLIPNNLFRKVRKQINLKHEPVLEQLMGHCSIYKIAFDLFQTKHHLYFEQPIRKRLTRIIFEI